MRGPSALPLPGLQGPHSLTPFATEGIRTLPFFMVFMPVSFPPDRLPPAAKRVRGHGHGPKACPDLRIRSAAPRPPSNLWGVKPAHGGLPARASRSPVRRKRCAREGSHPPFGIFQGPCNPALKSLLAPKDPRLLSDFVISPVSLFYLAEILFILPGRPETPEGLYDFSEKPI